MKKNPSWSDEDLQFLRSNYQHMTAEEIGNALGRSKTAVFITANKIGLKKDTRIYDEKKVEYIRENYKEANQTLAEVLGIGPKLIQKIRRDNEIPSAEKRAKYTLPEKRKWDETTVQYIRDNYTLGNELLSKELGLSPITIRRIRRMYGIENPNSSIPFGQRIISSAELEVKTMLDFLGFDYEPNMPCGPYFIDFVIGNKAIEVQGDYWHCNPEKYDSPEHERQLRSIESDARKRLFLQDMGYQILWVWESEIEDGRAFRKLQTFLQPNALPPQTL